MKPNDLRIGNYLYVFLNTYYEVIGISTNNLGLKLDSTKYLQAKYDDVSPIPLNEEWIIRFGFENNGHDFSNDDYCIHKHESHFSFHQENRSSYATCVDAEIKYVHQLQNLYFALTGQELTIKP